MLPEQAAMIDNSCTIHKPLTSISEAFSSMYRRRMFVHYYTQEGMSQDEFLEAEMNVNDLIGEFSYGMNYQAEEEEFE